MNLIISTCQVAIQSLAVHTSLEIACKITFAKVRESMVIPGMSDNLHPQLVEELRQVLEMGGDTIESMNHEHVQAKIAAEKDESLPQHWIVPPAWAAPGHGDTKECARATASTKHTMVMARDCVVASWKDLRGQDINETDLNMCMTNLAVDVVQNYIDGKDEELVKPSPW